MGFRERFIRFMQGRYGAYGPDRLNRSLNILAIILIVVSLFVRVAVLNALTFGIIALTIFRMLSKNYAARQRENAAYAKLADKAAPVTRRVSNGARSAAKGAVRAAKGVRRGVKNAVMRVRYFRTHRFYKCALCATRLRVPKVRGRLQISCPKCGGTFIAGGSSKKATGRKEATGSRKKAAAGRKEAVGGGAKKASKAKV